MNCAYGEIVKKRPSSYRHPTQQPMNSRHRKIHADRSPHIPRSCTAFPATVHSEALRSFVKLHGQVLTASSNARELEREIGIAWPPFDWPEVWCPGFRHRLCRNGRRHGRKRLKHDCKARGEMGVEGPLKRGGKHTCGGSVRRSSRHASHDALFSRPVAVGAGQTQAIPV